MAAFLLFPYLVERAVELFEVFLNKALVPFTSRPRWRNLSANAEDGRDTSLTPGSGKSLGGGNGNPLHYCWEKYQQPQIYKWYTLLAETEEEQKSLFMRMKK